MELKEIVDIINNYIQSGEINYENIYPDFPSGGVIINKNDLDQKIDLNLFDDYLLISTENAKDIERLEDKIKDICRINDLNDSSNYISLNNARQISRLKDAKKALEDAHLASCSNLPIDIVNIDLHHSWECLGEIIGEVNNDSLINELFSKFCLGK